MLVRSVLSLFVVTPVALGQPEATTQDQPPKQPAANAEQDAGSAPELDVEPVRVTLSGGTEYQPSSQLSDGSGEFSAWRASAGVDVSVPVSKRLQLDFGFATERSDFDFDDASPLALSGEEPWGELWQHTVSVSGRYAYSDRWSILAGAAINSGGESGAELGDTMTYSGYAAAMYAFSPKLQVGAGLGVQTRLEDDVRILPLPFVQFVYAITPRLVLGVGAPLAVSLTYTPNERVNFVLRVDWVINEYRLADDNRLPDGVLTETRLPIALDMSFKATPNLELTATVGVQAYSRFELDDHRGDDFEEADVNPAVMVGASLRYRF